MELQKVTQSLFSGKEVFEHGQRVAKMLSSSDIVPQQYKGNIPNTMVALNMANRMGADPMAVMQNLHIIHGRPSWSATFLISAVNNSGKCTPLRYKFESLGAVNYGDKQIENLSCTAWAKDLAGEVLMGTPVTIEMAIAEGWYGKKGSKWPTMQKQMLCYRAASFFARLYFPELTMGLKTSDEVRDSTPTEDGGYAEVMQEAADAVIQNFNQKIKETPPAPTPAEETPTATKAESTPMEEPPTPPVQETEAEEEGDDDWNI